MLESIGFQVFVIQEKQEKKIIRRFPFPLHTTGVELKNTCTIVFFVFPSFTNSLDFIQN